MEYRIINIWEGFKGDIKGEAKLTAYILDNSEQVSLLRKNKAVLICPGGGYGFVSERESEPVALAFLAEGVNAFVLNYEVAPAVKHPQPILDVSRAMCLIRENAEKWNIDTNKIALCGFSAGGHLAASLGVFWREKYIQESLGIEEGMNKPNALILCYPVISCLEEIAHRESFYNLLGHNQEEEIYESMSLENHINKDTPPTFIWHTFDDCSVPVENSLLFARGLRKHNIPFEMHIFPKGVHGLSLCDERTGNNAELINPYVAKWFKMCIDWFK
ncbi:MAG: alpha/beta hydrolase [Clostridiaceae bacterium]|nr:alpha/beta hydrolase [Clostridiaceae bacterium]